MEWKDGLQLAAIVALAAFGAMLVAVGALGSGLTALAVGAVWFWRMYRTAE